MRNTVIQIKETKLYLMPLSKRDGDEDSNDGRGRGATKIIVSKTTN